jgi:hypothetical protein
VAFFYRFFCATQNIVAKKQCSFFASAFTDAIQYNYAMTMLLQQILLHPLTKDQHAKISLDNYQKTMK